MISRHRRFNLDPYQVYIAAALISFYLLSVEDMLAIVLSSVFYFNW